MRIMGFSERWPKLCREEFTTFRFQRNDKDWQVGERVEVRYKPRSPERVILGIAEIVAKEPRWVGSGAILPLRSFEGAAAVSDQEAKEDGFDSALVMYCWIAKRYHADRLYQEPMNKLTLRWQKEVML